MCALHCEFSLQTDTFQEKLTRYLLIKVDNICSKKSYCQGIFLSVCLFLAILFLVTVNCVKPQLISRLEDWDICVFFIVLIRFIVTIFSIAINEQSLTRSVWKCFDNLGVYGPLMSTIKISQKGTSLLVQGLRLLIPSAGSFNVVSIPDQGTGCRMPQPRLGTAK